VKYPTQRQNVLRRVLQAPLCGTTRNPLLGQRIAARVNELRQVGFPIVTEPCDRPHHQHESRQIQYDLFDPPYAYDDNCAYCYGYLRSTGEGPEYVDGQPLLVYQCAKCGRKDLR
jgi:hypothetical protein